MGGRGEGQEVQGSFVAGMRPAKDDATAMAGGVALHCKGSKSTPHPSHRCFAGVLLLLLVVVMKAHAVSTQLLNTGVPRPLGHSVHRTLSAAIAAATGLRMQLLWLLCCAPHQALSSHQQ